MDKLAWMGSAQSNGPADCVGLARPNGQVLQGAAAKRGQPSASIGRA